MDGHSPMDMATSFRDPAGHVLQVHGRILRIINRSGEADFRAFLESDSAKQLIDSGSLVSATVLDEKPGNFQAPDSACRPMADDGTVVEHERVQFQSFPYEWPPEMVHAAGHLTIDMAESLLREGFGLKDATPYNILFHGPQPVFVDWLSFECRDPCDPTWLPYAQFLRTFLLPLLANKHFRLRFDHLLLASRDGLDPEEVYRLCGPIRKLRPPFLTLVSLPVWLAAKAGTGQGTYIQRRAESSEKARFILGHLFKGLRRKLRSVAPKQGKTSAWSDYTSKNKYTEDYIPLKQSFVEAALRDGECSRVLDVGCNTGFFSELAARSGASVVAIDYDPIVVGELWRRARAESLDILPLVVNLARPTPSTGWLNDECPSFLDRARGSFDAVLMLAVIHHLLVTERIPLAQIIKLASEMTTKFLVIEYVPPEDPMFRGITRGREHLHMNLTREAFETVCQEFFETERSQQLGDSGRWVYLLRKKREERAC